MIFLSSCLGQWPRHGDWRVVVSCSPLALVGHESIPSFVLYDPTRCKTLAIRRAMDGITQSEPRDVSWDTIRYIVRGPRAVGDPSGVDSRISAYTRRELGLFEIQAKHVTVWPDEDATGHSFDMESDEEDVDDW